MISNLIKNFTEGPVTHILIVVNLVIFGFYGFDNPTIITLLDLGGNFPPYSLDEEPVRLLTSMFLHGNVIHLLANMYSLYFVGVQVEKKYGSVNFLVIYFLTGLLASLTSVYFNLFIVSVGASGAIFGIYGVLIIETIRNNPENKISILTNFFVYFLIVTLIGAQMNFDNAAHIGGVLAGFTIGILTGRLRLFIIYAAGFSMILLWHSVGPRYQVTYFKSFQEFISTDTHINIILSARLSDKAFYDSLNSIKELPTETIKSFRGIEFNSTELSEDTTTIVNYLSLRKRQIDYFLKGLSKESFIYLDSIELITSQFGNLPKLRHNLNVKVSPTPEQNNQETTEQLPIVRQNYDSNWFETDSFQFEYFRVGKKDSLDDWHGRIEDYYKDGAIQMKGRYHRGLKEGIFIYYEPDSTYSSAGRYYADNRVGKWEDYHPNGQLNAEIRYEKRAFYVENIWDSLGNQMVQDRNGEEIYRYPNGNISYRRNIQDGVSNGFTESFYEDGNLKFKEYYEKGELIKGVSYFGTNQNIYDASVYFPYPEGGFDSFYEYIEKENQLKSDTIDNIVVMRFDVHYTGEINNIRFMRRYQKEYDEYARELLLNGPAWNPASSQGLFDVNSSSEITIRF